MLTVRLYSRPPHDGAGARVHRGQLVGFGGERDGGSALRGSEPRTLVTMYAVSGSSSQFNTQTTSESGIV